MPCGWRSKGAGVGAGDSVITTCFSFFATVSAILRAGAQPLLVDIDPETFNLDPAAARACLESATGLPVRALLPVHPLRPNRGLGLLRSP